MHILCLGVLFIVTGRSSAVTGRHIITGHVGSTATVHCQYEYYYRNYEKYWCRGRYRFSCSVIVESTHRRWQQGRTSISDNPGQDTFTVKMAGLREDDTDYYWCGVSVWGLDPMLSMNLTVIRGSSTANPNADLSAWPTEPGLPSFSGTPAETPAEFPSSKALEETTLKILVPVIVILLSLLLLTTTLFLRERRRRTQDVESDVSKSENMHVSDMPQDLSTLYAVIRKPARADAGSLCMADTARGAEPVGGYEETQPSPRVSDTSPLYAVVKKGWASRSHGIDNPATDATGPEHHYEEIRCPPVVPCSIPVYAVVKKPRACKTSDGQSSTTVEDCSEAMPGSSDVSSTTVPSTTADQQQPQLYSTVEFATTAPSEEPQYYLLTK